jgi:hypothetical protein
LRGEGVITGNWDAPREGRLREPGSEALGVLFGLCVVSKQDAPVMTMSLRSFHSPFSLPKDAPCRAQLVDRAPRQLSLNESWTSSSFKGNFKRQTHVFPDCEVLPSSHKDSNFLSMYR